MNALPRPLAHKAKSNPHTRHFERTVPSALTVSAPSRRAGAVEELTRPLLDWELSGTASSCGYAVIS
jgi:hypothetical protein